MGGKFVGGNVLVDLWRHDVHVHHRQLRIGNCRCDHQRCVVRCFGRQILGCAGMVGPFFLPRSVDGVGDVVCGQGFPITPGHPGANLVGPCQAVRRTAPFGGQSGSDGEIGRCFTRQRWIVQVPGFIVANGHPDGDIEIVDRLAKPDRKDHLVGRRGQWRRWR